MPLRPGVPPTGAWPTTAGLSVAPAVEHSFPVALPFLTDRNHLSAPSYLTKPYPTSPDLPWPHQAFPGLTRPSLTSPGLPWPRQTSPSTFNNHRLCQSAARIIIQPNDQNAVIDCYLFLFISRPLHLTYSRWVIPILILLNPYLLFIYIYCIIFYNKPCESKILCFVVSKLDVLIDFGRLGKAANVVTIFIVSISRISRF